MKAVSDRTLSSVSQIQMQVMWDRLIAVTEEQALTLIRTGFSTSTREAGDVSAGVFDTRGNMLAQAVTGTPGHVNAMARAVRHFLAKFPLETLHDGDVLFTNDPWKGTGHLHDFTFVTPIFRRGSAIGLMASTSHMVDVGGRGMGPDARQVYEEGIYIPLMHFARGGRVDEALIEVIRGNVREPTQVIGDLFSLAACNKVGGRRLVAMMDEFELDSLEPLAAHILERSREATLQAIRRLPAGTWRNEMTVDGYDKPVKLVATMRIAADGIDVDFTGTSGVSPLGINVPFCYTEAYSSFGIKCIVAPKVPNNEGSLSVIRISAPDGCILNAKHPAPVATRHVTGQLLPDLMFGCLGQAIRDGVPAEGTSCLWNLFAMGGADGRVDADIESLAGATAFNVMSFHSGGTGARPGKDGLSATAFPSGVKNCPIEITEALSPLLVTRKEYRTDSGGAGEFRGGLGQVMEILHLENVPYMISANYDRVLFPARGRDGGRDGACGVVRLDDGTPLRGKGQQVVPQGRTFVIEMPGGGGLGDPLCRDPSRVAEDVLFGLVSREAAERDYGVVLRDDCSLDADATQRLRAQRAARSE
ncbi:MAG TPA: hydantoinase B/oxoprolinase family protein [Burkholderiaceae bacterium]|nr:hydantoinase B/oxoprolinase family protein [Burkholderiaceae bacterium]